MAKLTSLQFKGLNNTLTQSSNAPKHSKHSMHQTQAAVNMTIKAFEKIIYRMHQ